VKVAVAAWLVLLAISLTGCQKSEPEPPPPNVSGTSRISGSISYRERMALTSEAVVEVSLRDVSIADAPAPLIGLQRIKNPGQVPIHFEISFPKDEIDPRRAYAVQARITDRDRLVFVSDAPIPVLTRGTGNDISMMLVAVNHSAQNNKSSEDMTSGFEIEGMFRYMADAALFRDCRDNRVYPVAMEGQYIELERAYLNSGINAGSEAYVKLRGRYLERPAMEGNHNEVNLIVDVFEKLSPDEVCSPELHADLQDTYWKLLELDGNPVESPKGSREIHLILATADSRAHGFAGCNNFFGTYQLEEDALSFSPLGSTMMACPEGMDIEQSLLQALGAATRAEISGQIMRLYADDRLLARFESVYL
jgi:uncharacterized lipoprotein YbaY/heat shock protein HslJ